MYLLVFSNPHDGYKEMKIPFDTTDDIHAEIKAKQIIEIWYPEEMANKLIAQRSIKLFRMTEIQIMGD
jgi:hypothetical protein